MPQHDGRQANCARFWNSFQKMVQGEQRLALLGGTAFLAKAMARLCAPRFRTEVNLHGRANSVRQRRDRFSRDARLDRCAISETGGALFRIHPCAKPKTLFGRWGSGELLPIASCIPEFRIVWRLASTTVFPYYSNFFPYHRGCACFRTSWIPSPRSRCLCHFCSPRQFRSRHFPQLVWADSDAPVIGIEVSVRHAPI